MNQYSYLSPKQERYILLSIDKLKDAIANGLNKLYEWDLQKEVRFLEKIIDKRAYDIFYDADRLNSIKNLIGYIDNKNYEC